MAVDPRLRAHLRRWGLRLRLAESLAWGPWGAAAGLACGLVLALVARWAPLLYARSLLGLAGLAVLVAVAVSLAIVWLCPRSLRDLARIFDRRLALAERLITAVEIARGALAASATMARAQLADALSHAARVDVRARLPLRASRPALLAGGALLAALALLLWLPNPQEVALRQRAAAEAAVEAQREQLEAAREEIAAMEGLSEADREELLRALEEAQAALEERRATPEEALAALSAVEQELSALRDPEAADVQAGLERAAQEMADSDLTRDIAEALTQGDYQAAAEALESFAGAEGEPLTREEELALAQELADAAQAVAGSDEALAEALSEAAQAIERGDVGEAREAIATAAEQLGESGARVTREEALEDVLAQLQEGRRQVAEAGGEGASMDGPATAGGAEGAGAQPGGPAGGAASDQPGSTGGAAQPGHHEDAGTGAPYEEVYVPFRLGEEGVGVELDREGEEGVTVGDAPLPAPERGRSGVPYREVYAEYEGRANATLEGSYIPLGLKTYVRDYFSSLEP